MTTIEQGRHPALVELDAAIERRQRGEQLADEAHRLQGSLRAFVEAAWPLLIPARFVPSWHIDAICEHLQAAYERDIARLLITIQPGSLKSSIVSVFGPAWRWAATPEERFVTASHSDDLATRDTRRSRALMMTGWYRERWPHVVFADDENLKTRYSNTVGGHRIRTHVGGGTGDRGSVLQLDDPHNAQEAYSDVQMQAAVDWWSDTWASRLDDSVQARGVKVVIGQRIHEVDLIGHLLANDEDAGRWTHLCLPARYESKHPYVTPATVTLPNGRELLGDPRTVEGELLAPAFMDEDRYADRTSDMTAHIIAGQYQQRPAPREGKLLKRGLWRYYPADRSFYRQGGVFTAADAEKLLPSFRQIVLSWDTSVKDRARSDYVSGQVWGVEGANRWLLRLWHERAGLNATIDAMLALHDWTRSIWPNTPIRVLVETAANGADAIAEIRSRVEGVVAIDAKGTKYARAEAASPALDGRNLLVPGWPTEDGSSYDTRTPKQVQDFIEELAAFDQGTHDDQVDAWSQMVNWTRQHGDQRGRLAKPPARSKPRPRALPA